MKEFKPRGTGEIRDAYHVTKPLSGKSLRSPLKVIREWQDRKFLEQEAKDARRRNTDLVRSYGELEDFVVHEPTGVVGLAEIDETELPEERVAARDVLRNLPPQELRRHHAIVDSEIFQWEEEQRRAHLSPGEEDDH